MDLIRNFEHIILIRQVIKKEVLHMACKGKGSKSSKGSCKTKKGGGCKK